MIEAGDRACRCVLNDVGTSSVSFAFVDYKPLCWHTSDGVLLLGHQLDAPMGVKMQTTYV